jgi:peroxiredoxin Q/BCP
MAVQLNQKAPDFTLLDQEGQEHSLSDYLGKKVLLYFYPKDDTPGCTTEACNFRDRLNELKKHNVQVLGVSIDDVKSHKKFAEKFGLNFPLLADTEKKVVNDYGVWGQKSMFGKKYMGIQRDSFLIDEKGVMVKHYEKVKPAEHVDEVVEDAKKM